MTVQNRASCAIDIGALSTPFHSMSVEEGAAVARVLYGLEGELRRFATEKDDTFRLTSAEGAQYVLKIANPGESLEEIDLQVAVLRHLEKADPSLPVPRVFATSAGALLPEITDGSGATRRVRLMSYLDGVLLDSFRPDTAELREVGRVGARLRRALEGFEHPAARRVSPWDVRHLPELAMLLDDIEDPRRKAQLELAFARYLEQMPRICALRCQVLHNDFSSSNLLLERGPVPKVAGVIDFGDTVETAIAVDLSTAMLNQLPRDAAQNPVEDLLAAPKELLAGYLEIADLTEEELSLLPHLILGRIIARALISLWRARSFPENRTYILRNTEQGWAQLDWFLARSPDQLSNLLL